MKTTRTPDTWTRLTIRRSDGHAGGCVPRIEQSPRFDVIESNEIELVALFVENRRLDSRSEHEPRILKEKEHGSWRIPIGHNALPLRVEQAFSPAGQAFTRCYWLEPAPSRFTGLP